MPASEADRAARKAAQAEITQIEEVRAQLLALTFPKLPGWLKLDLLAFAAVIVITLALALIAAISGLNYEILAINTALFLACHAILRRDRKEP